MTVGDISSRRRSLAGLLILRAHQWAFVVQVPAPVRGFGHATPSPSLLWDGPPGGPGPQRQGRCGSTTGRSPFEGLPADSERSERSAARRFLSSSTAARSIACLSSLPFPRATRLDEPGQRATPKLRPPQLPGPSCIAPRQQRTPRARRPKQTLPQQAGGRPLRPHHASRHHLTPDRARP